MNFRDLGGYATADGQRTRWRVLVPGRRAGRADRGRPGRHAPARHPHRDRPALGHELEQSRFDVEAHPVTFHHFPFIKSLPNAEDFERAPGFLGTQYQRDARRRGPADRRGAVGPGRARTPAPPSSIARPARTAPACSLPSCSRSWACPRTPWWPTTRSAARP